MWLRVCLLQEPCVPHEATPRQRLHLIDTTIELTRAVFSSTYFSRYVGSVSRTTYIQLF